MVSSYNNKLEADDNMVVETRSRRRSRASCLGAPTPAPAPWCSEAERDFTSRRARKLSGLWMPAVPPLDLLRPQHGFRRNLLAATGFNSVHRKQELAERHRLSIKLQALLFAAAVLLVVPLWWARNSTSLQLIPQMSGADADAVWPLVQSECCERARRLEAALLQAERAVRSLRGEKLRQSARCARTGLMVTAQTNERLASAASGRGVWAQAGADTRPWAGRAALWGVVPLWRAAPPPLTLLAARRPVPADCWPFRGSHGEVTIGMEHRTRVALLSVEHVRPDTARSAPRHFTLYGILENGTWIKGTTSEYQLSGPARQVFPALLAAPVRTVAFRVLSNHGNTRYTCVYRVQVHGTLPSDGDYN